MILVFVLGFRALGGEDMRTVRVDELMRIGSNMVAEGNSSYHMLSLLYFPILLVKSILCFTPC